MIEVTWTCDSPGCGATHRVRPTGNQVFSDIKIRALKPRDWLIRTPKQGLAVAYCPVHRTLKERGCQIDVGYSVGVGDVSRRCLAASDG